MTGRKPGARFQTKVLGDVSKASEVGNLEVLWDLFERTGSVEVYLLFHEAKKNKVMLTRAKQAFDEMKRGFESK